MATACALLAAALFAAALVTTQFGLRHMDALAGAKVSIPSAAAWFWLLYPVYGFEGWNTPRGGLWVFVLIGLFFPLAVTLLAYEANRRMGPTVAGAIGGTAPLFALLGAVAFLGEAPGLMQAGATLAIVAGSIVLSGRRYTADTGGLAAGQSWVAWWVPWLAAALRALAQVAAKAGLLLWPNPYAATTIGYSVSAVLIWLIAWRSRRAESRVYTRRGVGWFALTGLFNSTAVLALYTALERGSVNVVSPIVAAYPLFTLLLNSVILREERLTARLLLGVGLMVAGVVALL